MNISEEERITIETYDMFSKSWSSDHADMSHSTSILESFKKHLPDGSILEVGAGGSSDCRLLSDAGYDYFGTDAAAGMVTMAKERYPDITFKQYNIYDVEDIGRQFDGFWANAILLHIPKQRIDDALQALNHVIRKGGVGFISIKDGAGEQFEDRMQTGRHEKRLFSFWRREEFEQALSRNGFKVASYEYRPKNERSNWHHFYVIKL